MTVRLLPLVLSLAVFMLLVSVSVANADNSHARIFRLSLVQVMFVSRTTSTATGSNRRTTFGKLPRSIFDPPRRCRATDNGRAEVEFESGNIAFLAQNTVLEFYDLSLEERLLYPRA